MAPPSLYDLLGVKKDASQDEIKKAYRILAIKCHPDKCKDDDAQVKFQQLQDIYTILSDVEKRKIYDETGSMSDDALESTADFTKLKAFFRGQFKAVTEEEIEAFSNTYRGSEEEKGDVISWFKKSKGDIEVVFRNVMLSDQDQDSHRFADIIEAAIASGEIKKSKGFTTWVKQVRKLPRPVNDPKPQPKDTSAAGPSATAATGGSSSALVNPKRAKEMGDLFDALEQKYASKSKKGKKKGEPTEEEFLAIQEKMMAKKK